MNDDIFHQEMEQNRQAYEELCDKIRRDHAGQYVAMAFGRIILASPDFDEAMAGVKRLQPAPEHVLVFPANEEPAFEEIQANYTEFL